MTFQLYNTLSRKAEPLAPAVPGKVRLYCCGPTVYDVPHAGHARVAVVFDVLVRTLRQRGLEVTYVRNITDVEDKILKRAKENGETPVQLSERMTAVYREDMGALGCGSPDREPRVSEFIPQIIGLIQEIIAREAAYVVDMPGGTRDVYYSVRGFPGYGKLSRRKLDELVAGARVEADEANKRDPLDFALWKGASRDEWGWDSPWGWGRPGWHIECSAMSLECLGHGFEIHGGGMDLIFPHHENEIAQSEAARPDAGPMARLWMHNGFVNVDKEKMSKSLGNFVTVRDVLARNDPEALRWFLISVHYRGPIQFDTDVRPDGRVIFPGVDEAERRVDYLYSTRERLRALAASGGAGQAKSDEGLAALRAAAAESTHRADRALDDDLNTPVAVAELGEIAKLANELCDGAAKRMKDPAHRAAAAAAAAAIEQSMKHVTDQLGVLGATHADYIARTRSQRLKLRGLEIADIERRVAARIAARTAKDFAEADRIRNALSELGISLHDGPGGTTWTISV